MNPVLLICYNNLDLTRQAIESVMDQDIPVDLTIVDNGSTDETGEYLQSLNIESTVFRIPANTSPVRLANAHISRLLSQAPHVLSIPNDVRLPSNCYSEMLKWPRGFVCASDIGPNILPPPYPARAVSENTPMGVMLTRRWAYDAIVGKDGYFFDEGYFHYASDCDLALRMAACGIRGVQLDIPYYHFGSATHKLPELHQQSCRQADKDREYFGQKWGFKCTSLEYGQMASDPNWKAEIRSLSQSQVR